jgi:hypothetical protein
MNFEFVRSDVLTVVTVKNRRTAFWSDGWKMEAEGVSETLADFDYTTWRYDPEYSVLVRVYV